MANHTPTDFAPEHNLPILSVGELSQVLRQTVEGAFPRVRLRGEISGFKRPASGHLYFALKDEDAVLDAVCWKGQALRLGLAPEDGMEVVATGRLTTYPGRSKYQMVVEEMELAGEGALLRMLEERKRRLAAEGLFDQQRKKPLPSLPRTIGVVTSPTGAVIRDILHRLADRFPCHVLVWPVLVQGEGAAAQVAAAIDGFDALDGDGQLSRPDLILVARGGGSLEDLWAFNEEAVVRAVARCSIPVISAIGHETDTTLCDFAADFRAPTPTAAAEMAVPVRLELMGRVEDAGLRLANGSRRWLDLAGQRLEGLRRGLPDPARAIERVAQRLDDWSERLANSLQRVLERNAGRVENLAARIKPPRPRLTQAEDRLALVSRSLDLTVNGLVERRESHLTQAGRMLDGLSYRRTLERGYAVVRHGEGGRLAVRAGEISAGEGLSLEFADGPVAAMAVSGPALPKPRKKSKKDDRQGSLL